MNALKTSSTDKIIAAIIQPRLLRCGAAGGTMTGGGVNGGGGEPPADEAKIRFSIARRN